jgi:hypothetical protein
MTRLLLAAVALALAASVAEAQTCTAPNPGAGFVCVNLGAGPQWLPPGHPSIPQTSAPTPPPPAGAPDCDPRPNPYTEPDRAAACSAWDAEHQPKPILPTFVVGGVYVDQYNMDRMSVLAVSLSLEGVPVVTAQRIVPADGYVFSFRTNTPPAQQWTRVP